MKRKLLLGMFAALGMTLAISCSNDDKINLSEEKVQVTFSLGLENSMMTRAISDGTDINKLHYAIFNSEGNIVESSQDKEAGFPFNTTTSLVKGEEYTAVFWAQNKECTAYTVSEDMKTITVDYSTALNNDENRDAFFKTETFTVTEGTKLDIVLKRPFAQLNVGIPESDWQSAYRNNIKIELSEVEIKQAATTLNLMDGSVENAEDITFASAKIPEDYLYIDLDCNGEQETYKYLSMSYFLAADDRDGASSTLASLEFNLTSLDGSTSITLHNGLENAPVQRNHRTNIIIAGENVGINDIDVKVKIDPLYDGEHTYTNSNLWEEHTGIYTEEALAGKTIELPDDWNIRNGYIIQPMPENWTASTAVLYAQPYTLDGKGYTVTFEPYGNNFITKNVFAAADGELVTVKNIKFAGEHFGIFGGVYGGVAGRNNYNTVFENIEVINNGIYCYNSAGSIPMSAFSNLGTATLNNCTIIDTYWVGAEKDTNANAQMSYDNFGIYDIFVPNNKLTAINNSRIGTIYVNNHGVLKISGNSEIDKIYANALVKGSITVQQNAKVVLLDVDEYSTSYAPIITIEAGANIETLRLNSITNTTKINIDNGANIAKIIHKGVEYTSIADFKATL
ncbi:MAG: hypothetical protein J6Q08_04715 [Bacteroidaceae bacterium]|nr:hypothetical protein [Bacteroidaceae bacterium]